MSVSELFAGLDRAKRLTTAHGVEPFLFDATLRPRDPAIDVPWRFSSFFRLFRRNVELGEKGTIADRQEMICLPNSGTKQVPVPVLLPDLHNAIPLGLWSCISIEFLAVSS